LDEVLFTLTINLHKKSLAVKQCAALFKMASVKKICEIKGGGQEMAMMVKVDDKNVITAIQVNLCPASLGISTKNSPELLLLNFLPSTYSITAKCLCAWLQLARPAAKNNDSRSGELYF